MTADYAACGRILARHSKSFALAARLLARPARDRIAAVYAWCRECDDAVDLAPSGAQGARLARLREDLAAIYAGAPQDRAVPAAFQEVVRACGIPFAQPAALLDGLAMDVAGLSYPTVASLRLYAFRVAGTVGLMAARVLGARSPDALIPAAHLGIAMQLTNVCRDVAEDWAMGRLYVPAALLPPAVREDLRAARGGPLPRGALPALSAAVRALLGEADVYYRSADRGLRYLDRRARLAVRTGRLVYAGIGREILRTGCDVCAPRAVVPRRRKLALVLRAAWAAA